MAIRDRRIFGETAVEQPMERDGERVRSVLQEGNWLLAIILTLIMIVAGTWTLSQLVGFNVLKNGFFLVILGCSLSLAFFGIYKGKIMLETVARLDGIIIAMAAIMIVVKIFFPNFSLSTVKEDLGGGAVKKVSIPEKGFEEGKYFISLSPHRESEWLYFKQGRKYNYDINTSRCVSEKLLVVYSSGDTIKAWDQSTYGNKPSRQVKFKLVALEDRLDSILVDVKYL